MRVGVVGGTGTVGAAVVEELAARNHGVAVLSRRPARGGGHEYRRVDLATGEGLAEALAGLDAVVDAANAPRPGRAMRAVMVEGTGRLLRAEAELGIEQHVLISIVGIEQIPMAYYRVKLEQERLVREAPVRGGILRSTQFHQLVDGVFQAAARAKLLPGGKARLQPVDPREVARVLAEQLEAGPWEGTREVAGPEILTLTELARTWRRLAARRTLLLPLPMLGATGRALADGALTAPEAARESPPFSDWLSEREQKRHADGTDL